MAELFSAKCVLYNCSCNLASPFTSLYFCRYCTLPRCSMCVYHEIDSYFCSNCLENMPSAEAKLKKNRCGNCYECPSCSNTLSTRATAVAFASENPDEKATAKKVFYLACGFCRWSTRDVGIPDRNNASGGWHEPENPVSKRVNNLVDFYRKLAVQEKYEREKAKLRKKNYIHITTPSSFGKSKSGNLGLLKKRSSLSLLKSLSLTRGNSFDEDVVLSDPAVATEDPPRQPLYTEVVQLEKAASISQMLAQPEFQHSQTCEFHPRHKHLVAKRSQRCRQCEHNLCKPEFNPSSTKYKIQFFAMHYVPRLQVAVVPELQFQKKVRITLSLENPMDYPVNVTLKHRQVVTSPSDAHGEEADDVSGQEDEKTEHGAQDKSQRGGDELVEKTLVDKHVKIAVDNSADNKVFEETAEVNFPTCALLLAAKDDAAEFEEITATKYQDDPEVIASRQANKLWFYVDVTPLKSSGDVQFSFIVQYDFKTVPSTIARAGMEESQESKIVQLEQVVYLNLGNL